MLITEEKRKKILKIILSVIVVVPISVYISKPTIDSQSAELMKEKAIEACGGEDKVKNITSEGFECKSD